MSLPDIPITEPVSTEQGILCLILPLTSLTLYEEEIRQPQEETRKERVAIAA